MKGLVQLLAFLNNNWTFIIITIGLILMLYKKIKEYLKLSNEEKINAALCAIKNTIVGKMTDAQIDWYGIKDAGSIKRAKVISKIYDEYPILKNYVKQDELIKKIDAIIDEALAEVKQVAENAITIQSNIKVVEEKKKVGI
jgi:predicted transcriptional regulator